MNRQHPDRISCWLGDDDAWLHDALDDLIEELKQSGVKTSKGDLVRQALLAMYGDRKGRYVPTGDSNSS